MFLVSMGQTLSLFFQIINLSLIQWLYFFLSVILFLIHILKYQVLFWHLLQYLHKCLVFMWPVKILYPCIIVLLFLYSLIPSNLTKTQILLLSSFPILIDLNRLLCSWTFVLSFHFNDFHFISIKFLEKILLHDNLVLIPNNSFLLWLLQAWYLQAWQFPWFFWKLHYSSTWKNLFQKSFSAFFP